MEMREYIAMLEARAEYEAAEALSEAVSEGVVVPLNQVVSHKRAAEMARDRVIRPVASKL